MAGRVTRLVDYGAFVAVNDEIEGLVHITEMAEYRVYHPEEVVLPGEEVWVKVLAVDRKRRCVRFYADLRSPKVAQIEQDPRAALVFQDAVRQVELRAEAVVRLHRNDNLAQRCWTTLSAEDRREFASAAPPGSPADELSAPEKGNGADRDGWDNFAVADCTIGRLDWLELDSAGHRRAVFAWNGDGDLRASWVTP